MEKDAYMVWLVSTGQLPQLFMLVLFVAFIVGLFVRNFRNF